MDQDVQHQDISFSSAWLEGTLTDEQLLTLNEKQLEK
jgi:hypothetical protein